MSESVVILNGVKVSPSEAAASAFGRLRTAEPFTLWDTQFQYDKQPLFWDEETSGGGSSATHIPDESSIGFTVGTGSGDYVIRQSRNYLRYKPGKSQLVFCTGILGAATAGVWKRFGYFDDDNGVFIEVDGSGVNMVLRSSITGTADDTRIPQTDWNLNKLDGTNGSPVLDPTKAQIFVADLEWLGVGRVRVGLVIDGHIIYVHEFNHANNIESVYMTTANLPLRYEVRNSTSPPASPTTDFKQICSTVISEGGADSTTPDQIRSQSSDLTSAVTVPDTGLVPILSVRLKPTLNSIDNRCLLKPRALDLIITTVSSVYWEVVINPTLSGGTPTWTDVDATSIAQYNIDSTGTTGGQRLASGFAQGTNQAKGFIPLEIPTKLRLARSFDNSDSDIVTLQARSLSGNADVYGILQWAEFC